MADQVKECDGNLSVAVTASNGQRAYDYRLREIIIIVHEAWSSTCTDSISPVMELWRFGRLPLKT